MSGRRSEHKGKVPSADHGKGKRWQARWRDATGKQCKENFDRRVDADARAAKVDNDLNEGTYLDPSSGKVTLEVFAKKRLASLTGDPGTYIVVELRIRLHVLPHLGHHQLRVLRPTMLQAWLRDLEKAGLAASYIRVIFANLSAILLAAVDDGVIAKNPCSARSIRLPRTLGPRSNLGPHSASRKSPPHCRLPTRALPSSEPVAGCGRARSSAWPSGISTRPRATCTCDGRSS
ncbi:N-terminal phage integrase SAM-like domain-containing protein [Embleya sp. NBC_00888]|uniref:hypothetical protein n=1 Tax=Embleya sp. NBC_00888 TaxID=2975960 RepID=UPI003864E5E3|nr:N-terminal phage integrase SAM-like domain-containing protein [Embleya sp. NBC_00888]